MLSAIAIVNACALIEFNEVLSQKETFRFRDPLVTHDDSYAKRLSLPVGKSATFRTLLYLCLQGKNTGVKAGQPSQNDKSVGFLVSVKDVF